MTPQVRMALGLLIAGFGIWVAHRLWHMGDNLA